MIWILLGEFQAPASPKRHSNKQTNKNNQLSTKATEKKRRFCIGTRIMFENGYEINKWQTVKKIVSKSNHFVQEKCKNVIWSRNGLPELRLRSFNHFSKPRDETVFLEGPSHLKKCIFLV